MDQGIAWAKQHGLYVIMDWHSIGNLKDELYTSPMYNTTKAETFKFWRTVARRYKDEPAVALYELFNEPTVTAPEVGDCTWTEWRDLQEQIIDTVRTYNPRAVCLCAGFNWAYDLTPVAAEPVRRENIGYVCHPYPMKRPEPWEEKWEADFGYVSNQYPVICTEIGFCLEDEPGAHIPVISTDVYGEHITRYLEQKGISFTVWCGAHHPVSGTEGHFLYGMVLRPPLGPHAHYGLELYPEHPGPFLQSLLATEGRPNRKITLDYGYLWSF